MCRSIKQFRNAAARQFVRKVSGYRRPSRANKAAFEQAITEINTATKKLLNDLIARSKKSATTIDTFEGNFNSCADHSE